MFKLGLRIKGKKGTSESNTGSGAAVLIALIGVIIILYVLLAPTEFRQGLLNDTPTAGPDGTPVPPTEGRFVIENPVFLSKTPGTIDKLDRDKVKITIPSSKLETKHDFIKFVSSNSIFVQNSLLNEERDTLAFTVKDFENVEHLQLSFKVKKSSEGRLAILLNNNGVFNGQLTQPSPNPIILPSNFLQHDNVLEFRVTGAGAKFWKTNSYLLENIEVNAKSVDTSQLVASNTFIITADDLVNTEKASLTFTPICLVQKGTRGVLEVQINGQMVSSSAPLCSDKSLIGFAPSKLVTGENKITFTSDKGGYIIDEVKITLNLEEPTHPVYYFEVDAKNLAKIRDTDLKANLKLKFASPDFRSLTVYVNGHAVHIDQSGDNFQYNVEQFLDNRTNSVKIEPRSDNVNIRSLEIVAEA